MLRELERAGLKVLCNTRGHSVLSETPPPRLDQVLEEEADAV